MKIANNEVRFKIAKDAKINVGDWVQLAVENNRVVVVLSKGLSPLSTVDRIYPNTRQVSLSINARDIKTTTNYFSSFGFPVNADLYVNSSGQLTVEQFSPTYPVVGSVLIPPSKSNPELTYLKY